MRASERFAEQSVTAANQTTNKQREQRWTTIMSPLPAHHVPRIGPRGREPVELAHRHGCHYRREMKSRMFVGLVFLALLQAAHGQNYKLLKSIPIGGEGGWDYLAIDATARKLYVTHASKIVIVDLAQDKVVGEIADTPGVHGFAIAPELGHGFSSNGAESRVSVVDLKTLQTITKIETGENTDAILFEPTRSEVYAFNGRGKSATAIDAKTNQVVATVPLSGKPEFAAVDGLGERVFCNIEDK